MTYLMENGQPEVKSDIKGCFNRIHSQAAYSKKKIKSGPWKSKVFRHPEESPSLGMSQRQITRKAASQARREKYRRAAEKYQIMVAYPYSFTGKNGEVINNRGEKGKFAPRTVIFS